MIQFNCLGQKRSLPIFLCLSLCFFTISILFSVVSDQKSPGDIFFSSRNLWKSFHFWSSIERLTLCPFFCMHSFIMAFLSDGIEIPLVWDAHSSKSSVLLAIVVRGLISLTFLRLTRYFPGTIVGNSDGSNLRHFALIQCWPPNCSVAVCRSWIKDYD